MSGIPDKREFRDAHVHIHAHGAELSCVNLAECDSLDGCFAAIARAAHDKREDEWVECVGARPEGWRERRWPTAKELHAAAGGCPCVVRSFDHHALSASTRALILAGITRDTPDPPGGVVERDASGELTGLLLESACRPVWNATPAPTTAQRIEQVRRALTDVRSRGFVEVHDMLAEPWLGDAITQLVARGDPDACAMTVWLYVAPERVRECLQASARWPKECVRLAGGKLFLDGTINSRTAWMLDDFREPIPGHPRGVAMRTRAEIVEAIRACDAQGLGIAMHAIGDAAVREGLDALEEADPTMLRAPASEPWRRARLEHCEFIDASDVERFVALNVVCSAQPCHLLPDIEALRRYLPHRIDRLLPLDELAHSMERAGVDPAALLWLGSDAPIVPPSVADNVQAAAHRRRASMREEESLSPAHRLTETMARALHRPTAWTFEEMCR